MSYNDLLELPIKMFWTLNAQIPRIRSEENLYNFELNLMGMADSDLIERISNKYKTDLGTYVDTDLVKPKYVDNTDIEASIQKLKDLQTKIGS